VFSSAPSPAAGRGRALCINIAAKRLSIPKRTLRHLAAHGRIRAFKSGRRAWSLYEADVEAFRLERDGGKAA